MAAQSSSHEASVTCKLLLQFFVPLKPFFGDGQLLEGIDPCLVVGLRPEHVKHKLVWFHAGSMFSCLA